MNYEAKKLLFEGAVYGILNKVKEGLRIVKDVNIQNEHGMTPLNYVSRFGYLNVVKYLIFKGADVNIKNNNGVTPLHNATLFKKLEVVKILISNGADVSVNTQDNEGMTPLHYALESGNSEIVKYIRTNISLKLIFTLNKILITKNISFLLIISIIDKTLDTFLILNH